MPPRRSLMPSKWEDLIGQLFSGMTYAVLAQRSQVPVSTLRRQVLLWCVERNPEVCRRLWPPSLKELRAHAADFGLHSAERRGPLSTRNRTIVQRFAAGETYRRLAWDYHLSIERIAQIVHGTSLRLDPQRHRALIVPYGRLRRRIPQDRLRQHLQTLLAEEQAHATG